MPKSIRLTGDYSENAAIAYFQKTNHFVFKSCQSHGAVDRVTINMDTGELKLWDVKTQNFRKDGTTISRLPRRKRVGNRVINLIYYDTKKEKFFLPIKRKFKNKRKD